MSLKDNAWAGFRPGHSHYPDDTADSFNYVHEWMSALRDLNRDGGAAFDFFRTKEVLSSNLTINSLTAFYKDSDAGEAGLRSARFPAMRYVCAGTPCPPQITFFTATHVDRGNQTVAQDGSPEPHAYSGVAGWREKIDLQFMEFIVRHMQSHPAYPAALKRAAQGIMPHEPPAFAGPRAAHVGNDVLPAFAKPVPRAS